MAGVNTTFIPFDANITSNATISHSQRVAEIVRICFSVILCIVMFGVGCAADFVSVYGHFKRPAGICTGIFNQFIIMPVLALAFVYITQMNSLAQEEAMAVLIQGTAPGGMMSNIITYWINGDINLSISMTAVSTVIALGSMPLWLFIFTHVLNVDESLRLPFKPLGIALAIMVAPLICGAILHRYKPKIANIITKVTTIFGTLAIIITLIVGGIVNKLAFYMSVRQWLISLLTPAVGIILGYLVALIPFLKLNEPCRRTIAIETGMQNCQVSQSVIVLTYSNNIAIYEKIRLYPMVNSFFQIAYGVTIAIIIRKCMKSSYEYSAPLTTTNGNTGCAESDM